MNISYDFLSRILEVPALRLEAFKGLLAGHGTLSDTMELKAVLVYAHVLKYAPPEIATLLVARVMDKHGEGLAAISVINKSGLVTNGTVLWDLMLAKEIDASKLQGIYEQHGLDLDEYSRLIQEAFSEAETKRGQRRSAGVPRGGAGPQSSDAPAVPPVSPPGPESASPQP